MAIERIPAADLVRALQEALARGDGYIMGAYGQNPRTGQLDAGATAVKSAWKTNGWYFTQYSGAQREQALRWRARCQRVWDCNGLAEGVYQLRTGVCIDSKARYNYAQWCSVKGAGMIPPARRVPGAAVFWGTSAANITHVAFLEKPVKPGCPEGDWTLIEARGVMYGVVRTRLLSRGSRYWGWMDKYFDYSGAPGATAPAERVLRNGCEGEDVRALQANLIRLGYDCGKWGADGDFGDATELALRAFQAAAGLAADGEAGPLTRAALERALAAREGAPEDANWVRVEDGDCYVRAAPGVGNPILGVARAGETLPFGGQIDEATGWLRVRHGGRDGWLSDKYGRLVNA